MKPLSEEQLVEMLEHDEDSDLWLINEDGSTLIVPDQDIRPFQTHSGWPRYICRSYTVNSAVRLHGVEGATVEVNKLVERSITNERSTIAGAAEAAWGVLRTTKMRRVKRKGETRSTPTESEDA